MRTSDLYFMRRSLQPIELPLGDTLMEFIENKPSTIRCIMELTNLWVLKIKIKMCIMGIIRFITFRVSKLTRKLKSTQI
jgi:hypothetical protein